MPQRKIARLPFDSIRALVEQKIPKGLLSIWKVYLLAHPSITKLWGQEQHSDFIRKTLYLALYKDLFGIGYDRLVASVDVEFQVRAKTLRHNTKLVRKILFSWSKNHIVNEGKDVWDAHRSKLPSRKGLHKVNLIVDSSDFRQSGKQSMSRKDRRWSYKLNGPGQRYTVIMDARGVIQKVWGGYSPKVYDGEWVNLCSNELAASFNGAHIIGDTHYELGNQYMSKIQPSPDVKFYTPVAEPRGRKRKRLPSEEDPTIGISKLTKDQQSWNSKISHLRARVESPFGDVKRRWVSLGTVFYEDDDQQDYLIHVAFGVHNWMKRHPNMK